MLQKYFYNSGLDCITDNFICLLYTMFLKDYE